MNSAWQRGLAQLADREYWEAHESWEDVWRDLPESADREATQALIQFAAACYKVEQAAQGRDDASMQDGLEKLLELARGHLAAANESPDPSPSFDTDALRRSLDDLDEQLDCWRGGADRAEVRRRVATIAESLVSELSEGD